MLSTFARRARDVEGLLPLLARVSTTSAARNAQASMAKPSMMKEFQLYRFDPEKDEKPYYKSYQVDINKCAPPLWTMT